MKDTLNDQQQLAVATSEGPVLILAGAGSGKTKTLTHRIARIISEGLADEYELLTVTFTNKAAKELRERIGVLLGGQDGDRSFMPYTGTFHGICVRILRIDGEHIGVPKNFVIFDSIDQKNTLKAILKELKVDLKQYPLNSIQSIISNAKNELMEPEDFERIASGDLQRVAVDVWRNYKNVLQEAGALDFDDLIVRTVDLFSSVPEVRSRWQNRFKYISIDEYQDTNQAQYQLIQLLIGEHRNICVVGDDWQSIYSWRGANYKNILNFEKDFPSATVIKLEQNYRSTKNILEAAHKVIAKNDQRSEKKLWSNVDSDTPVVLQQLRDEVSEGEFVVQEVRRIAALKNRSLNSFAVLYRTNAQSRALEEQFLRYGMKYKVVGGVRFYERKEIKDIVAYLRWVFQPNDRTSFLRIVNTPGRGLGKTSVGRFQDWASALDGDLSSAFERILECPGLQQRAKNALEELWSMREVLALKLQNQPLPDFLESLIVQTKFLGHLDDGTLEGQSRVENVRELLSLAEEYRETGVESFLEEVALISDVDGLDEEEEGVTMMTIHAAKGLEFDTVFMIGMEETIFPHSRSLFDKDQMEEERRLCYVGMTRAKEELFMCFASARRLFGMTEHNPPSRFLSDLGLKTQSDYTPGTFLGQKDQGSESAVKDNGAVFRPGMIVSHKIFGLGRITELEGDVATIAFEGRGAKKLNTAFAPLDIVEESS